jgi:hypothetical protein
VEDIASNIFRVVISRKMKRVGGVARIMEVRNTESWLEDLKVRDHFGRHLSMEG